MEAAICSMCFEKFAGAHPNMNYMSKGKEYCFKLGQMKQTLNSIKKSYVVDSENWEYIERFLHYNQDLLSILKEAVIWIRKIYPDAVLHLEAYARGLKEEVVELGILIKTKLHVDEAMLKIPDLDNCWWITAMMKAKKRLFVDLYDMAVNV